MNREFWEVKAKKYPRPFDEKNLGKTKEIIDKIKAMGVSFSGRSVVDIGCGTGNYGLLFAGEAKEVFCLDFSKAMIEALAEEVKERGIKNVSWGITSFADFNPQARKKYFDISFASMTPAVKTESDVLKMEALAREYCVFIGWAGKRENALADSIISAHGIAHYYPKGFLEVGEILKKRNISFVQEVFETSWGWTGSIQEALEDFSARIKLDGKIPDEKLIRSILEREFPSGTVEMTTYASQGILVWKP